MTSKIKEIRIMLILCLLSGMPASVYALDINDLFQSFSQQKESHVDFDEEKYAFYLAKPLRSSGQLQFTAPDKLYKLISKPEKISQKISGNVLQITQDNNTRTINLDNHPEFSAILGSLKNLLAGNLDALQKNYKLNIEGTRQSWKLHLLPRSEKLSGYIKFIDMHGNNNLLTKIIITESNNDYSVTHLYNHR